MAHFKAPRVLSHDQQQRIADKLKPFPKAPFVFSIFPEPEPAVLMEQIGTTLELAEWTRTKFPAKGGIEYSITGKPSAGMILSFSGLRIEVPEAHFSEWGGSVGVLLSALNAEGVETTAMRVTPGSEATSEAVAIFVGKKP